MRTTIAIDDELAMEARELSGINGNRALVHHALRALVQREAAQPLARWDDSNPDTSAARCPRSI
jgi:Arc/MetJ family transcription regulator